MKSLTVLRSMLQKLTGIFSILAQALVLVRDLQHVSRSGHHRLFEMQTCGKIWTTTRSACSLQRNNHVYSSHNNTYLSTTQAPVTSAVLWQVRNSRKTISSLSPEFTTVPSTSGTKVLGCPQELDHVGTECARSPSPLLGGVVVFFPR